MEYTVDRIEGNYALLEDSDTKKIIEVPLDSLPKKIIEGEILTLVDGIYQKDNQKYLDRKRAIMEKMARLKKEN